MQNANSPQESPKNAPAAGDLFAANKAINAQSMAPAQGFPAVPAYKPSGKVGALALPLALLSLLILPALGALLYDKLWHFGGFLIFSQLALGALVGALLYPAVHWGKIRNTVLAGILGGLVGAATFFGAKAFEAWQFRPEYIEGESAYIAQRYHLSPQKARAAAEGFYTPANTLKFYWLGRAQVGMSISSTRTRSTSQISGTMFWVVEGVELLLVTLLATVVALSLTQRRFNEEFNRWFISKGLGTTHPLHLAPLLQSLQAGDYAGAAQYKIAASKDNAQGPQISAAYIPEKAGAVLTVKAKSNKGMQTVFERDLSNDEMRAFWPTFPAPNASASISPFSS
ncbi:hypothetical protein B1R32_102107 [Abditibacterium utsteinense]|uniref:Uncharacterized protein n=1 Tax=Abditibacterium utsteinense TaxID=1960156 RepID=A0A2S8SWD5_9BACT|nr:hypothetical protein [Abditibacterium utsteinense]PQV65100.1 hypothetical protein B1R32_102107 [Abditibacterium utsteinense]